MTWELLNVAWWTALTLWCVWPDLKHARRRARRWALRFFGLVERVPPP